MAELRGMIIAISNFDDDHTGGRKTVTIHICCFHSQLIHSLILLSQRWQNRQPCSDDSSETISAFKRARDQYVFLHFKKFKLIIQLNLPKCNKLCFFELSIHQRMLKNGFNKNIKQTPLTILLVTFYFFFVWAHRRRAKLFKILMCL